MMFIWSHSAVNCYNSAMDTHTTSRKHPASLALIPEARQHTTSVGSISPPCMLGSPPTPPQRIQNFLIQNTQPHNLAINQSVTSSLSRIPLSSLKPMIQMAKAEIYKIKHFQLSSEVTHLKFNLPGSLQQVMGKKMYIVGWLPTSLRNLVLYSTKGLLWCFSPAVWLPNHFDVRIFWINSHAPSNQQSQLSACYSVA